MWLPSSWTKVKNHLPGPVGGILPNTTQDGAGCLCHKGTLSADVQLGDSQCFSALSQSSACSRVCGLLCPRCRTSHFSLSNFMGFPSANFPSLSRSLCMAAQPSAVSNTFQLCHLYSNETRQESRPVLSITMWLSLLMTQTLWSKQHQPSCHKLWAKKIISQLNIWTFFHSLIHTISFVTGHFEATSALDKSGTSLSDVQLHTVDPSANLQDHLSFT